ncbi:class I SAM-dependent methyltransferase [Pseudohaliea sp.]|uniref:class I SAM-dependent methyltransferase n=1 Tax=Pseudohaliea sp. TaxID=2740289 RepID=UPI0032EC1D7C
MQTVDFSFLALPAGARVLDLGCGEGRHVHGAAFAGFETVGVDLSPGDLATARARLAELPPPAPAAVVAADALTLPFADGAFDAVIMSEVLEHIPDYRAALAEATRVLRPDGLLCVSVPRAWPERLCWRLSRGYHQVPGGHLRIFRREALEREVAGVGYRCYHRHGAHALHVPYWWLQCLFWEHRERSWLVRAWHRLLVWDMLKAPWLTRRLEKLLDPFLGKSVVLYFRREATP